MTNRFPPGWDGARVRRMLDHYRAQSEEEQLPEDEAVFEETSESTVVEEPKQLVPAARRLIADEASKKSRGGKTAP